MDDNPANRWGDWGRLAILLVVAAAVRCWLLAHTEVPARDCIDFVRCAVRLDHEPWHDVLRSTHQAPGYPAAIWLAAQAARAGGFELNAENYAVIARLISAISGLLNVVPMYLTGRKLFGATAGFLAALLFQSFPVCVRVTSDGLSEGLFFLLVALALWLGVSAVCSNSPWRYTLCGLTSGLAYWTRPEGLEVVVAVGFAALIAGRMGRSWAGPTRAFAALACGLAPTVAAHVAVTGHLTNKPASVQMFQSEPQPVIRNTGGPPLAAFWADEHLPGPPRAAWALRAVMHEATRASHYYGLGLALAAVWWFRARLRRNAAVWALLALPALHWFLLGRMAATVGYVSERHAIMVALGASFWAGGLLAEWARRWRLAAPLVAVAVLALGWPSALKPLHGNRAGHRAAGQWLAANACPQDEIIDPFGWAYYYAGSVLSEGRVAPAAPERRVRYVVLEEGRNAHERLVGIASARELAARGECVHRSPAARGAIRAAVAVYRLPPGQ